MSLFVGQAFLYKVFFTFALVLTKMLHVSDSVAPWYLIPLAIGNFLGPLVLGKYFDTVGRRVMITGTYVLSGLLLILTGVLFNNGVLTANTLTQAWCVVFFFAVGTELGGIIGPVLFGKFIEQGRGQLVFGYYIGAGLMIAAGIVTRLTAQDDKDTEDGQTPSTSPPTTTTRSTYAAMSANWSVPERAAIPRTAQARCAVTTAESRLRDWFSIAETPPGKLSARGFSRGTAATMPRTRPRCSLPSWSPTPFFTRTAPVSGSAWTRP